MQIETQLRHEGRIRAICDPHNLPLDLRHYEAKTFPESHSHTLYFGQENGVFPEGFAFRIRMYGNPLISSQSTGILDPNAPCYLEIKHPIEDVAGARKKLRFQTTVQEAIHIATSKDNVLGIFGADLPDAVKRQIEVLYASNKHVVPLCGVSYERKHFENTTSRVTIDANIHSFSIVHYDGVWFVRATDQEPYSMLEIKQDKGFGEANISKFRVASLDSGASRHIEPGMNMKKEGDWVLEERELKIDTIGDPREALKTLASTDELSVGPWKEGSSMMQFIKVGANGVCIMGREGVTNKMAIKYKLDGSDAEGVLTRTEYVMPYSLDKLLEIVRDLGGNPELLEKTSYFTRNRAMRLVVSRKTGNIFAITADRCVNEDGRSDLNQTEIEYRGRIVDTASAIIDEASVREDFRKVSLHMYQELRKHQLVPAISHITKYEWASKDRHQRAVLPESFRQGNNAQLTVDIGRRIVRKKYDMWGAISEPEQVVTNYVNFRDAVQQLYTIPANSIVERSKESLVVEEALISGTLAKQIIREGSIEQTADFIRAALSPLKGQIMTGESINCGEGRISHYPLRTPIDIKPDNFVITPDGGVVFVDLFPPLNRQDDGRIVTTYQGKGAEHDAWVYGEASVLITRFLMRCIMANPKHAHTMASTVLTMVQEIDPSGFLLQEMKVNTKREKTIVDFAKVENGLSVLEEINAA